MLPGSRQRFAGPAAGTEKRWAIPPDLFRRRRLVYEAHREFKMTDTLTRAQRSHRMSLIRGKDTKPEWLVRRLVHGMGYRYRLHRGDLPGRPDLVFASRRKVLFVHGCYWHR